MIRINLLGDSLAQVTGKKSEKGGDVQIYTQGEGPSRSSFPIAGVLIGLVIASTGGVWYIKVSRDVDEAAQKKAKLEQQKAELQPYIDKEQKLRQLRDTLKKKKDVMVDLRLNQRLPVHLMEEIAKALPDDVWFSEVTQKGTNISIKGESASFEAINLFRTHLGQTTWFSNVIYPTTNKKGNIFEFTLSFDMKNHA